MRKIITILMLAMVLTSLSSCGRMGDLKPATPENSKNSN
jgi:predicted small lipoprotein YifL|tara:strand:+ start:3481 stop:3597 length:117 start_codon:yes stop_codon:yes gene_type:complete